MHECEAECEETKNKDYYFDRWEIDGVKYRRCPLQYVTQNMDFELMAYRMFKNGFLLENKGWSEHSYKYISLMFFIDNIVNRLKKEESNG